MTPLQFRNALRRLDLTQQGMAKLLGADERTARRWALGERAVPSCVEIVLKLMVAGKITTVDIEAAR